MKHNKSKITIEEINKSIDEKKAFISKAENHFPIEVFPDKVQNIIREVNKSLNFPIDYLSASILFGVSVAIGNTHKLELKKGFTQTAILYIAIVGKPGTVKSHPLSWVLKPIEDRDSVNFMNYEKDKKEFEDIISLSVQERKEQEREIPSAPYWSQSLVTDFTIESLVEIHKCNKKGLGIYADELAGWFKNFNRYNNGSDEQFWLSSWSGKSYRKNRLSTDPSFIKKPFISVIGTIQPAVLDELAKGRTENGFLDRFLFAKNDNIKKEAWNLNEISEDINTQWKLIMDKILDLQLIEDEYMGIIPKTLRFSDKAKSYLINWQKEITEEGNNSKRGYINGLYAKLEQYALRFCLIIEILKSACDKRELNRVSEVSLETVKAAITITNYFKYNATKIYKIISEKNPVDDLPDNKKELYDNLPNIFKTGEGVKIAENFDVKERSFKTFIQDRKLFRNLKHGSYERLL